MWSFFFTFSGKNRPGSVHEWPAESDEGAGEKTGISGTTRSWTGEDSQSTPERWTSVSLLSFQIFFLFLAIIRLFIIARNSISVASFFTFQVKRRKKCLQSGSPSLLNDYLYHTKAQNWSICKWTSKFFEIVFTNYFCVIISFVFVLWGWSSRIWRTGRQMWSMSSDVSSTNQVSVCFYPDRNRGENP